ncbi:putative glycosyltransferase [groundwater metagenome]|uniref:Putative glycosyltransferase n=1 Tax=groundwater metagenome TaxID=717931 RepID=A0A098E9G7_9ZZZZ
MKICYLTQTVSNDILERWAKWFASRGHEVHLILPKSSSSFKIFTETTKFSKSICIHNVNIDIPVIKHLPFYTSWNLLLHRKIISKINPDIIHGLNIIETGIPVAFSGNYVKVVDVLGVEITLIYLNPIYKILVKTAFRRSHLIHFYAENLYEMAKEVSSKKDKDKMFTSYLAVDTKIFNPNINPNEIRKRLELGNDYLVITTRSFASIYNIECLIDAIPIVLKEIPNVKFILKSWYSTEHADRTNKLKNKVKKLKVFDCVKFIDYVPYNDLPKYLACADVYVSTSLFDGLGISNIEALACGTPAVLADIDSTRNLIKKGLHAHLYLPKDSNALAKEIVASIKNREKDNKEIHKENFRIIKEHYDFDKNIEKIEQLYKDLIDKYKK